MCYFSINRPYPYFPIAPYFSQTTIQPEMYFRTNENFVQCTCACVHYIMYSAVLLARCLFAVSWSVCFSVFCLSLCMSACLSIPLSLSVYSTTVPIPVLLCSRQTTGCNIMDLTWWTWAVGAFTFVGLIESLLVYLQTQESFKL